MSAIRVIPDEYRTLYTESEGFRAAYNAMHEAVDSLPEELQAAGQVLPYPQLHYAVISGDRVLLAALLDQGLDPDMYPHTGYDMDETPLVWLARSEELSPDHKIAVANLLISRGADVEEGEPIEAARDADDLEFAVHLEEALAKARGS